MAARKGTVFINVPFDGAYEQFYISMVAGLVALGSVPHCALEVTASAPADRMRRIFDILLECESSIHDLSRVELSAGRYPRFNMPLEAGLAIAIHLSRRKHGLFILEAKKSRLRRTTSDLDGFDPFIHAGTVKGMLRILADIFDVGSPVDIKQLLSLYQVVAQDAKFIKRANGGLFRANAFRQLVAQSQQRARAFGYVP